MGGEPPHQEGYFSPAAEVVSAPSQLAAHAGRFNSGHLLLIPRFGRKELPDKQTEIARHRTSAPVVSMCPKNSSSCPLGGHRPTWSKECGDSAPISVLPDETTVQPLGSPMPQNNHGRTVSASPLLPQAAGSAGSPQGTWMCVMLNQKGEKCTYLRDEGNSTHKSLINPLVLLLSQDLQLVCKLWQVSLSIPATSSSCYHPEIQRGITSTHSEQGSPHQ